MDARMESGWLDKFQRTKKNTTRTSLYGLIEALQDEVSPGGDALVVTAVSHLMRAGRVRVPFSGEQGRVT